MKNKIVVSIPWGPKTKDPGSLSAEEVLPSLLRCLEYNGFNDAVAIVSQKRSRAISSLKDLLLLAQCIGPLAKDQRLSNIFETKKAEFILMLESLQP